MSHGSQRGAAERPLPGPRRFFLRFRGLLRGGPRIFDATAPPILSSLLGPRFTLARALVCRMRCLIPATLSFRFCTPNSCFSFHSSRRSFCAAACNLDFLASSPLIARHCAPACRRLTQSLTPIYFRLRFSLSTLLAFAREARLALVNRHFFLLRLLRLLHTILT